MGAFLILVGGNVHTFTLDLLGRMTAGNITPLTTDPSPARLVSAHLLASHPVLFSRI
jgi:hypothetical protein